ncbi:hypothetical protein TSUD_27430 [Trifolium subterraneum]|uniref:Protein kinase domain-containing protein n=1 Tax=Trifolium subterraneum TaxID=3900 RepID=A0A2Z6NK39_TRISU|nr:hypothetical protein TSUD_27430 [Trifolium subterraneum]
MSLLTAISAAANHFHGSLPPNMFHTIPTLLQFFIGGNQFSGPIPTSIENASMLVYFDISQNHFVGQVPSFGKLKDFRRLNLEGNNLGYNSTKDLEFLKSLTNCSKLEGVSIASNNFGGVIPATFGKFKNMQNLDLGQNKLSGDIPTFIDDIPDTIGECISLEYLSLQGNSFHGTIPSSLASLKSLQYVDLSRNQLSGPIPNALKNISSLEHLNISFNMLEGEVPTEGVFGNASRVVLIGNNKLCGGISELNLTLCPVKGSFGSVYKGYLVSEDKVVAIKVLNLQKKGAGRSFIAECQEFKALIYEYMKNGSLEQWLHPNEAKLVSTIDNTSQKETSSIGIKGTVGYAPPEYGMGSEVSTYGDMYSFGMLMLETLTGRRPTNEMFEDGLNLHSGITERKNEYSGCRKRARYDKKDLYHRYPHS